MKEEARLKYEKVKREQEYQEHLKEKARLEYAEMSKKRYEMSKKGMR